MTPAPRAAAATLAAATKSRFLFVMGYRISPDLARPLTQLGRGRVRFVPLGSAARRQAGGLPPLRRFHGCVFFSYRRTLALLCGGAAGVSLWSRRPAKHRQVPP